MALLTSCLLLPRLPAAWAQTGCPSEAEQIGLARSLLAEGDYFRAITEFKRFLFLFPQSKQAEAARFGIADALLGAGRYDEAEAAFRRLRDGLAPGPAADRASFGQALALLKSGRRREGRKLLRELATQAAESRYRSRAQLELALSLAEEGDWAPAQEALRSLSEPGPVLEARLAALREGAAQAKSPALAGALSAVVPGAGQLYCGRLRDAGLALLLNGLFIWGATEAGLRGNYGLAAGLGLIELAWYGGTVYGALSCAYKQQRAEADRIREQLLRGPPEAGPGLTLAWGCRF